MQPKQKAENKFIVWLGIFGAWMLVAVIFTSQFISQTLVLTSPIPLWRSFAWQLASACGWFALTPLVLWLGRKFPLKRGSFRKNILIHVIAGAGVVLLQQVIDVIILPPLGYPPNPTSTSYWQLYYRFVLIHFHANYLLYWMIVGIQNAAAFYRDYRERELQTAQLEGQLAQARLQVLKNQLHPHFLFNTLNAVSELIYENQETAELMIANLSDLLRLALDKMHVQEVSLRQELEFLKKYLEIEQMRFDERLQIKMSIQPDTLDASVPNMILQPLVENSVKHGIAPLADGGTVEISAERQNGDLRLRVADNGIGVGGKQINEGVGLSNTRARLAQLYGAEHLFEISPQPGGGLQIKLQIPYKTAAEMNDED